MSLILSFMIGSIVIYIPMAILAGIFHDEKMKQRRKKIFNDYKNYYRK